MSSSPPQQYRSTAAYYSIKEFDDSLLVYDRRNGDTHQLSDVDAYLFSTLLTHSDQTAAMLEKILAEDLPSDYHQPVRELTDESLKRLQGLFLVESISQRSSH